MFDNYFATSKVTHAELTADTIGFKLLSEYLENNVGVKLPLCDKNTTLMSSRLHKIINKYECKSYKELYKLIVSGDKNIISEFVSAMTTHTTHFFRESAHFELLNKELPNILKKRNLKDLRCWIAAASTGEEAWSLAMTLSELQESSLLSFNFKILATDIDKKTLSRAAAAIYDLDDLKEIPLHLVKKYFYQGKQGDKVCCRVKKKLRQHVTFAEFNLLEQEYIFKEKFNIIFCRNVLIYFEKENVIETLKKLEDVLALDGFLCLGHSEAVIGFTSNKMKKIAPATYLCVQN